MRKQEEKKAETRNAETREQTMKKLEFYIPTLSDAELRLVSAFIQGIKKGG